MDRHARPVAERRTDDRQEDRYREAVALFGSAIGRLALAYEADREARVDLIQDIHVALWRSMGIFDNRCSLRTWVYRVAHNVAASHVLRVRRLNFLSLTESVPDCPDDHANPERTVSARMELDRVLARIRGLPPVDRLVILLYLEDIDAATIADITGLSANAVSTRLHRIRKALARQISQGQTDF